MAHHDKPTHASRALKEQADRVRNLFSIPAPIKKVFDSVPIVAYSPNDLPSRTPKRGGKPSLYVFSGADDARNGRPSFNPGCLKWQTFLNISGVQHDLVCSNNHASPTGLLPFLLPALQPGSTTLSLPIPSNKLVKFAADSGLNIREPPAQRYDAYKSLLDQNLRRAWLYSLYLSSGNASISNRLYVHPASSNPLVNITISHQLRAAAEAELKMGGPIIDVVDLYSGADVAFEAFSVLLGGDQWFFTSGGDEKGKRIDIGEPTIFDAEVFAYTHLLLDEKMEWQDRKLTESLSKWANLVSHRNRILRDYY